MSAARSGRYAHRDATLILVAYRHGLRASEIADLEWSQVEFGRSPTLYVRRVKNGKPSAHPLRGEEVRALRELRRQSLDSAFVFARFTTRIRLRIMKRPAAFSAIATLKAARARARVRQIASVS